MCGNAVCEAGEDSSSCASDCHPGTWANRYGWTGEYYIAFGAQTLVHGIAAAPSGAIALVGASWDAVDFGTGPVGGPTYPSQGFLARFTSAGAFVGVQRFPANEPSVATDSAGNIVVAGSLYTATAFDQNWDVWLTKFSPTGATLWSHTLGTTTSSDRPHRVAVDADGNVLVTGEFIGTTNFGRNTFDSAGFRKVFVAKYAAADGAHMWSTALDDEVPTSLTVDAAGHVVVASYTGFSGTGSDTSCHLRVLSAGGTTVLWSKSSSEMGSGTRIWAAAPDAAGDIFVTGTLLMGSGNVVDFGGGPETYPDNQFFVAKYSSAGAYQWAHRTSGGVGTDIQIDGSGNAMVVGGFIGALDLGAGEFDSDRFEDPFLAMYSPTGAFRWAKRIPMVLHGNIAGAVFNSDSRVVISGQFDGSMLIDDRILINQDPEALFNPNEYLGAFTPPCSTPGCDTTPPVVGDMPEDYMPAPVVVQATSPAGATVFFVAPTSTDTANSGTNVACSPASGSTFPLGTTTVTCSAFDPTGNAGSRTTTVTVVDTVPPTLKDIPYDIHADATVVTWPGPTAIDVVDGARSVTCVPASGTSFPVGTTTVSCASVDTHGNESRAAFDVIVSAYAWSGILQPINADGSSIFKLGSTVPVKFQLASGATNAVVHLFVTKITSGVLGTEVEAISTAAADVGNTFRYDAASDKYIFNLSTSGLSKGTWQLKLDFGGGITRTVNISLK